MTRLEVVPTFVVGSFILLATKGEPPVAVSTMVGHASLVEAIEDAYPRRRGKFCERIWYMPNIRIAANQKADLEHLYQQWSSKLSKEKKPEELLKPEPMVWSIPSIQTKPGVVVPMAETRINNEFADFLTERRFPFEIISS